MLSIMIRSIVRRILNTFNCVVLFTVHYASAIWFRGKGKTVPPVTNPLLLKSATQLAQEIREGKLKSENIVLAYIERIREVEPYINATVDCCFLDALKEAREVDSLFASGNYSRKQLAEEKPLLGVPFTVKLQLKVKGLRCTAGCRFFENDRADEDASCVAMMKKAGAIVIATTNVPELGQLFEAYNFLHGRTSNPFDTNRTCGGSSGGEGALIGAGGSVLGVANDILGSLRVPAHFSGIFSHKPSKGLVPNDGSVPTVNAKIMQYGSTGPMCRYAEDLIVSMKILSSQSEAQVNFRHEVDFKKLKICYLTEIVGPFIAPVDKDIAAGLRNAVSYFVRQYGAVAKQVKIPSLFDATRCVMSALLSGTKDLKDTLTNGRGNNFNEKLDLLKWFFGSSYLCFWTLLMLNFSKFPLVYRESRVPYYEGLLQKWTEKFDSLLDDDTVLLVPTFPFTAPYHNGMLFLLPSTCYTSIFSVLGLPSTQCPVGYTEQGMPYGIQIVARRNNDALTIACAVELENAFGGWKSPGAV